MAFFRIIIPTYNGGKYLPTMVESIRKQSFQDYHLIIVDDMSTDDTPKIIDSLRPSLYITLDHKGYAAGARNVGMKYYKDDIYTLWLDDDDRLIDMDALQKIHDVAVSNKYPDIIRLNWIATKVSTKLPGNFWRRFPDIETPENICLELYGGMPWTKAVKTEKCVEFPENLIVDDCFQHILQCDECETAAVIHDSIYEWLIRDGSITTSVNNVLKDSGWYIEIGYLMRARDKLKHEWAKKAVDRRIDWLKRTKLK